MSTHSFVSFFDPPSYLGANHDCNDAKQVDAAITGLMSGLIGLLTSSVLLTLSLVGFAITAYRYVQHFSQSARTLEISTSAAMLTASALLLELVLAEIHDTLDLRVRRYTWPPLIRFLLLSTIVLMPLLLLYSFFGRSSAGRLSPYRTIACISGLGAWLFVFWNVRTAGAMSPGGTDYLQFTDHCLLRVGIIGVTLMALLAGFGSARIIWNRWVGAPKNINEVDVTRAKTAVDMTEELIMQKRKTIQSLEKTLRDKNDRPSGMLQRVIGSISGGSPMVKEISALQMEVIGLDAMLINLQSDYLDKSQLWSEKQAEKTLLGKLSAFRRRFLSLYCIYRTATALISILRLIYTYFFVPYHPSTTINSDPISNILALCIRLWDKDLDRESWARQIGFTFSGVIIAGSVNNAVTLFKRFAPLTSTLSTNNKPNNSRIILVLLVGELAGFYSISTALMIRSSLPEQYGRVITDAIGTSISNSRFFDRWFDAMFLVSAASTAATLHLSARAATDEEAVEP